MKIGVNVIKLYPGKIGGAEQYVRNVIKEMANGENINIAVFVNTLAYPTFQSHENIVVYEINNQENTDAQLNYYIDNLNLDIMFCPLFFLAPKKCSIPSVVSILDIQHEFYPQYFQKKVLNEIRTLTKETLEEATAILTISDYSKKTIIDKYGIDKEKIEVTYLSADSCFNDEIDSRHLDELKRKIGADYIFYPANTWPHKNHINLLKAYTILKKKYGTKLKLVFTGDEKQQKEQIEKYIETNHLKNDIIYLGYIEQKDMPYIFRNAKIMAYPSLFEGFGIPLIEAMRAETAIACSSCGSIPEVAGDSALVFDAYNEYDIAEKLNQLENDEKLRNSLIEKGRQRASIFSWEKCAAQTVQYLQKVLAEHKKQPKYNYNEFPLVTIITPSYNQGEFIKETIESVLNQDYPNIEYMVMDGGSKDQTVEILNSYGDRITWVSEKDGGQADAVNKGIRAAHGEIIGWLNSDDTYLDGAVSKMVNYLKKHPYTDMVYGEGYYIDKNSNIIERYLTEKFSFERLAGHCIVCQPTAFFTKRIVNEAGLLDKDLHLCMDYELWMKIAKIGNISYINDYIATSRMYAENKTLSRRTEVYKEICATVKKYYGYVPISWIQGYADYICNGNKGKKYQFNYLRLLLKYNRSNIPYLKNCMRTILKSRLRIHTEDKSNFEGKYGDKWLSKVYKLNYNTEQIMNAVCLEGNHLWPYRKPVNIRITVDRKFIDKLTIKNKGSFNKKILLNESILPGQHEIKLEMDKTFCPLKRGINMDNRNLSIQLNKLEFIWEEYK